MRTLASTLTILVLLCSFEGYSQIEQYNYKGVQTYESGDFTTYYLDFEFFQDNIQGRAIVDYGGPDETLYYIKGTYNKETEILQFKASYLVWTKYDIPPQDDCVLRFRGKVKNLKTVKAFSGPYTSMRTPGESCSKGLLIFSRALKETPEPAIDIEEITTTTTSEETIETQPLSQPKPTAQVIKPTLSLPKKLESTPIKKDENLNVFVKNPTVKILIYDAGKVDNDRISIHLNGELIVENYRITREKKELEISLENGQSIIEVTALNEGTKPPNTVKVEINDGTQQISTRTSLNKGEKATLTLLNN